MIRAFSRKRENNKVGQRGLKKGNINLSDKDINKSLNTVF